MTEEKPVTYEEDEIRELIERSSVYLDPVIAGIVSGFVIADTHYLHTKIIISLT